MIIDKEFLDKRPLSYSSLCAFKNSPSHYIHYLNSPRSKTPALVFGNIVDCLVLTPDKFEERYAVSPDVDRRTKIGKEQWIEFMAANKSKEWIEESDHKEAVLISQAVFNNPIAKDYLDRVTRTQRKLNWVCKETGLPMVCYLDGDGDSFIMDLKTTVSAHPEEFMRSAYKFNYHIQAGTYLEAVVKKLFKYPDYIFIVVEKTAPYGVSVFQASEDFIALGKQEFANLKTKFKYCMDKNLWAQTYEFHAPTGVHILDIPGYAKNKLEE